jgi:hypothetical protein
VLIPIFEQAQTPTILFPLPLLEEKASKAKKRMTGMGMVPVVLNVRKKTAFSKEKTLLFLDEKTIFFSRLMPHWDCQNAAWYKNEGGGPLLPSQLQGSLNSSLHI